MVKYYSVQFSSVTQSCPILCHPMNHSMPGLPVHHQLLELTQTHAHRVVMPSSHLILCRPLLLLPTIPPSIRVFSNESTLHMRWPKYWNFSFSIIPSKEIPGLISFRMDWLDLLEVQGTLKSLLQQQMLIIGPVPEELIAIPSPWHWQVVKLGFQPTPALFQRPRAETSNRSLLASLATVDTPHQSCVPSLETEV